MNTELITSKIADLANDILETKLELVREKLMKELRKDIRDEVEGVLLPEMVQDIMSAQTPSGMEGKIYNAFNTLLVKKYANGDIDLHETQDILTIFRGVERDILKAQVQDDLLRLVLSEV
jgi:hypothetical protein